MPTMIYKIKKKNHHYEAMIAINKEIEHTKSFNNLDEHTISKLRNRLKEFNKNAILKFCPDYGARSNTLAASIYGQGTITELKDKSLKKLVARDYVRKSAMNMSFYITYTAIIAWACLSLPVPPIWAQLFMYIAGLVLIKNISQCYEYTVKLECDANVWEDTV